MSFALDLRYLITVDSSLNTAVENRIYFENLEENYDITKDWIVYSFKKSSQQDCLTSTDVFTIYNVYIRLLSMDTVKINSLSDYIQDMLNNDSYGNIHDIRFVNDTHSFDLEKGQYSILLEFSSIYV
jgi:hypothetical protein